MAGCQCATPVVLPPPPDAGTGEPARLSCTGGLVKCDGECRDVLNDARSCGFCGNQCPLGEVCEIGRCGKLCPSGQTNCFGECANLKSSGTHCGVCGKSCREDQVCFAGGCTCPSGSTICNGVCANLTEDPENCGSCGTVCNATVQQCAASVCAPICQPNQTRCRADCADLETDVGHCGTCDKVCSGAEACVAGTCRCDKLTCGAACVDPDENPQHCGGCGKACQTGQACVAGRCELPCPAGSQRCGNRCIETQNDPSNCGLCGTVCASGQRCSAGACQACSGPTADCDNDGFTQADGDCCDSIGACGSADPRTVNPGAVERLGNKVDDDCDGRLDGSDSEDLGPCDEGLPSDADGGVSYARAIGICKDGVENPTNGLERRWGLLSAALLRADGTPLNSTVARSIRSQFGQVWAPLEGVRLVVLSSGVASDATGLAPGPNGGPQVAPSGGQEHSADLVTCTDRRCLKDWFAASNPPLKNPQQLPVAPNCGSGNSGSPSRAQDSALLYLRVRVPTNAYAFRLQAAFFSAEYPEYVCSSFNDQLVALVDTPGGQPQLFANPPDKNLMTYSTSGQAWPVGINVARGTDLFARCQPQATFPNCWDFDVSSASCGDGAAALAGTGFEATSATSCAQGGASRWLRTAGNVRPGEVMELRIAIWDVGDTSLDSLVLLDRFEWLPAPVVPGTE